MRFPAKLQEGALADIEVALSAGDTAMVRIRERSEDHGFVRTSRAPWDGDPYPAVNKRVFEAMMAVKKIDVAAIEKARRR